MTKQQAMQRARERALKTRQWRHVMLEDRELDWYETATDYDLETWYLGDTPVASFDPNGYQC